MLQEPPTFWQRSNAIANAESLTSSQKLLLYVLNNHIGNGTTAWPSIATICKASGLAEKSVRRTIKALQAAGILKVETGGGRTSNRYSLDITSLLPIEGTPGQFASADSEKARQNEQATTGQSTSAALVNCQDEQTRTTKQPPKKRGSLNSGRISAADAWQLACDAVQQFDPLYEPDKIREFLSDRIRTAARAAGGLPRIAGRDRYTATKIRQVFVDAYNSTEVAHV